MRRQIIALACAAAGLAPAAAQAAEDAFALFERFLAQPAAALTFTQTTHAAGGEPAGSAAGALYFQRPGKFRLQYDTPDYPLVVSDGETVWLYEEEIQQVIIQPYRAAEQDGIFKVLAGGGIDALQQEYVLSAGVSNATRWLHISAKSADAPMRHIALGFDSGSSALAMITLTDHFDNTIRLTVSSIRHAIEEEETALFSFAPPPGSDVIHQPQ